jgi:hypothetical protein
VHGHDHGIDHVKVNAYDHDNDNDNDRDRGPSSRICDES